MEGIPRKVNLIKENPAGHVFVDRKTNLIWKALFMTVGPSVVYYVVNPLELTYSDKQKNKTGPWIERLYKWDHLERVDGWTWKDRFNPHWFDESVRF